MRILIVNDDGIYAKGINVLAEKLCASHEVWAIAPIEEKSGASHSLTFHGAIDFYELQQQGYRRFVVYGTPCDCVKFGTEVIMDERPDVIISGINNVANIGTDAIYSGTVNAAIEGSMLGYKSIAVSLDCEDNCYDFASEFISEKLEKLLELLPDADTIWNINIPFSYKERIVGVKFSTCGKRIFADEYQYVQDKGWFITGHPINVENAENSDVYYHEKGYITVTPIKVDFNDRNLYEKIKGEKI